MSRPRTQRVRIVYHFMNLIKSPRASPNSHNHSNPIDHGGNKPKAYKNGQGQKPNGVHDDIQFAHVFNPPNTSSHPPAKNSVTDAQAIANQRMSKESHSLTHHIVWTLRKWEMILILWTAPCPSLASQFAPSRSSKCVRGRKLYQNQHIQNPTKHLTRKWASILKSWPNTKADNSGKPHRKSAQKPFIRTWEKILIFWASWAKRAKTFAPQNPNKTIKHSLANFTNKFQPANTQNKAHKARKGPWKHQKVSKPQRNKTKAFLTVWWGKFATAWGWSSRHVPWARLASLHGGIVAHIRKFRYMHMPI